MTRQPAPNQYDTSKAFSKIKDKRGSCDAAFKSKTKRSLDQIIKSSGSNLSPAQYDLHRKLFIQNFRVNDGQQSMARNVRLNEGRLSIVRKFRFFDPILWTFIEAKMKTGQ